MLWDGVFLQRGSEENYWSMRGRRNICQEALPYKDLVNKELWLVGHMISFIVIPLGSLYNVEEEKCDLILWT